MASTARRSEVPVATKTTSKTRPAGAAATPTSKPSNYAAARPRAKKPAVRAADADDRLLHEIGFQLIDDDALDASDVEVAVDAGVVTLSGAVGNKESKRRCVEIAEAASGQPVTNLIKISRRLA